MSLADWFEGFLGNLRLPNEESISLRYGEITAALNKGFRNTESKTANSLQVGSYGRHTAIKGISDLDMLYIVPASSWDDYKSGGQSRLLARTREAIKSRYPRTEVFVDRLVVRVLYNDFHVEVQPVFEQADGSFTYPDTKDGGAWKTTRPRLEIKAISTVDGLKNGNLRRLCRMVRAWKNKHGIGMGGLLVDTLAHNFLQSSQVYDKASFASYGEMTRDFFDYLAGLPQQDYFAALGSGQRVRVKKKFQAKARKARLLCDAALAADGDGRKWRKVFGRAFPTPVMVRKAYVAEDGYQARDTQEWIEDRFPVDVRYDLVLDCDVEQDGFRRWRLREMLDRNMPLLARKSLRFKIAEHTIPTKFDLYWKVLNRGSEAIRRDCIRGQIVQDAGLLQKVEPATFRGDHVVEAYAVVNGVVVATDRIHVPIQG